MANSREYPLLWAVVAQLWGVTLASIGCVGIFGLKIEDWSALGQRGVLIVGLIGVSYLIGFVGLITTTTRRYGSPTSSINIYRLFVFLYLYSAVLLLTTLVICSGGVKQSLFTPLFFAIPAMAVVFVPPSKVSPLHIWLVTIMTLTGYLFVHGLVYWSPAWLLIPTRCLVALRYSICESLILVGSVLLTVAMSRRVLLID